MKWRILFLGMVFFAALWAAHAVERDYATGKILDVQQRTRDRVLLYQVNTPIMTEDPYVTISVDVNGSIYEGEFLPRTHHEIFSGIWKSDETVQLRLDKHFLYLRRADGSDAKFLITRKGRPRLARESN
jgi:hypothetical protein